MSTYNVSANASLGLSGSTGPSYVPSKGLSFVGDIIFNTVYARALTSALSFSGNAGRAPLFKRTLTAALSFTGARTVTHILGKVLTAGLSFVGAVTPLRFKNIAVTAALSFVGTQVVGPIRTVFINSALAFNGITKKMFSKTATSTVSFKDQQGGNSESSGGFGGSGFAETSFGSPATGSTAVSQALIRLILSKGLSFVGNIFISLTTRIVLESSLAFNGKLKRGYTFKRESTLSFKDKQDGSSGTGGAGYGENEFAETGFASSSGQSQPVSQALITLILSKGLSFVGAISMFIKKAAPAKPRMMPPSTTSDKGRITIKRQN